jgi:hypothetical protein
VIAADTSSSAGATIDVVDGAAAEVASLIASPMPLTSADTLANASGAVITKDDISGSNHQRGEHNQGNERNGSCRQWTGLYARQIGLGRNRQSFIHLRGN